MNFKTTILLLVAVGFLGVMFFVSQRGPKEDAQATTTPEPTISQSLVTEDELGEVARIKVDFPEKDTWVFALDPDADSQSTAGKWRMAEPFDVPTTTWQVDQIARQIKGLTFDVSYTPGAPGAVSPTDAGLDPPRAVITLTDDKDRSVSVELGSLESSNATYVRRKGVERIAVAKANLKSLLKDEALEYREQQLWRFPQGDAQRVEITDQRDPNASTRYVLAMRDGKWMFEAPFTARATDKIDEMVRSISSLRALRWHDQGEDVLSMYGLENPALTVAVTVEEEVPVEEEGANEAEDSAESESDDETAEGDSDEEDPPATTIELKQYVVHFSERSPLGKESEVYMRPGDGYFVGSAGKTIFDRCTPDMSTWREMSLTTVNVADAERIALETEEGGAVLVKSGSAWTFDGGDDSADSDAVNELLTAIADLQAVAFVESAGDLSPYGLDQPVAEIALTIPGVEGTERLAIGDFTDQSAKHLRFVRRNEVNSIAKVLAADLEPILRGPNRYRDKTLTNLTAARVQGLTLAVDNPLSEARDRLEFKKHEGDVWRLVDPVNAPLAQEKVKNLVKSLSNLRAVATVADEAEVSAYGLHDPSVEVALTHLPPKKFVVEPVEDTDGEGARETKTKEVQPSPEVIALAFALHDGKAYVKRADSETIYEVDRATYDELQDEFRDDQVMAFETPAVQRFEIRSGDQRHAFERKEGDGWVYAAEPDLPLDAKKVDSLLLQIRDLRAIRYVAPKTPDEDRYGLEEPAHVVTVTRQPFGDLELRISDKTCPNAEGMAYYARVVGHSGVFLLGSDSIRRIQVDMNDLVAK